MGEFITDQEKIFRRNHEEKVRDYHALYKRWQITSNPTSKKAFETRLYAKKAEIMKMQDDYAKNNS